MCIEKDVVVVTVMMKNGECFSLVEFQYCRSLWSGFSEILII